MISSVLGTCITFSSFKSLDVQNKWSSFFSLPLSVEIHIVYVHYIRSIVHGANARLSSLFCFVEASSNEILFSSLWFVGIIKLRDHGQNSTEKLKEKY